MIRIVYHKSGIGDSFYRDARAAQRTPPTGGRLPTFAVPVKEILGGFRKIFRRDGVSDGSFFHFLRYILESVTVRGSTIR